MNTKKKTMYIICKNLHIILFALLTACSGYRSKLNANEATDLKQPSTENEEVANNSNQLNNNDNKCINCNKLENGPNGTLCATCTKKISQIPYIPEKKGIRSSRNIHATFGILPEIKENDSNKTNALSAAGNILNSKKAINDIEEKQNKIKYKQLNRINGKKVKNNANDGGNLNCETNPNINNKKVGKVKDYNQLYSTISKDFDDIYANDNDNLLILKENKLNNNSNINSNNNNSNSNNNNSNSNSNSNNNNNNNSDNYDEEEIDGKIYIFPKEYKNIAPVFHYGKKWKENIDPTYLNLKEEVINNKYDLITKKTWNRILEKCEKILKGGFSKGFSKREKEQYKNKTKWSKICRKYNLGMKNLVALKLYTDFDSFQREFKKSFRAPYNKTEKRLQSFFHWRKALQETFEKLNRFHMPYPQPNMLFHGINSIMCLDQYEGIYYGPCSGTTDLHVARSFAGQNGMILVMKPETNLNNTKYKSFDLSWISDYPDEKEHLLFNHNLGIETWILSSDHDQYYHYYQNTLMNKKVIKGPSGHLSYPKQKKIPKLLTKLKLLIEEEEIWGKENGKKKVKIKQNINFSKDCLCEQDKIDLLIFLFQFALRYKYGKKKPSKYDQSLNANIQHIMRIVHKVKTPPKLFSEFMNQLRIKFNRDVGAYFIKSTLNEYFINTHCTLDPYMPNDIENEDKRIEDNEKENINEKDKSKEKDKSIEDNEKENINEKDKSIKGTYTYKSKFKNTKLAS